MNGMAKGAGKFAVGQPVRRVEDGRLVTGHGRFTDDYAPRDCVFGVVLRSPHAHARILSVATAAALASPGVLAVLTGGDCAADGIGGLKTHFHFPPFAAARHRVTERPVLCADVVRHVGDAVAFVVAETIDQARDAAELIDVDYRELPANADTSRALDAAAPRIWPDLAPDNIAFQFSGGDAAAVAAAFAGAAHITTIKVRNNRLSANPLEPRAAVGAFDPWSGRYTLYSGNQSVHNTKHELAADVFHVPAHQVRVMADDMGGGFGMREGTFPEFVMVLWAARRVGRPVKWVGERAETFISDYHARDNVSEASIALSQDGDILALKARTVGAVGAYLCGVAQVPLVLGYGILQSVYKTPAITAEAVAVFTNTLPTAPYRGAGRPEAIYLIERLLDKAAAEAGLDRIELRRRNLIAAEAMPFQGFVHRYDSGDFPALMEAALGRADMAGFAARRRQSQARGMLRGIGIANHIMQCGAAGSDFAQVRLEPEGGATVMMGTKNHGQGHETVYAQMAAERLGIPFDKVRVVDGDTDLVSFGRGTYGSRSMAVGGSALRLACDRIIEKAKIIAGHALEAATGDIAFDGGRFTVVGSDKSIALAAVCKMAYPGIAPPMPFELGLDEQAHYTPTDMTFPSGCHIAEVEVDPGTGKVGLLRYTAMDDYGTAINPLLLEGQVHGAIVQGAGQALYEDLVYGDDGQLLAGSFMDYCLPRASHGCEMDVGFRHTAATGNLLGVKGAGETGTVAALPAVMNAVVHALSPLGITEIAMPATPERVWKAINNAQK